MKTYARVAGFVFLVAVAAGGWALYWQQRNVNRELVSKATPVPSPFIKNRIFGNFQKYENGTLSVGIRTPTGDGKTLETRVLQVSPNVTVIQFDTATNAYVTQPINKIRVGTWLLIDTDDTGNVVAITAGR